MAHTWPAWWVLPTHLGWLPQKGGMLGQVLQLLQVLACSVCSWFFSCLRAVLTLHLWSRQIQFSASLLGFAAVTSAEKALQAIWSSLGNSPFYLWNWLWIPVLTFHDINIYLKGGAEDWTQGFMHTKHKLPLNYTIGPIFSYLLSVILHVLYLKSSLYITEWVIFFKPL